MVKVVHCCTSEKTTFELRQANIFFPLIMISDVVAQFSGDAQYPVIRYAQSQVEKGVHVSGSGYGALCPNRLARVFHAVGCA